MLFDKSLLRTLILIVSMGLYTSYANAQCTGIASITCGTNITTTALTSGTGAWNTSFCGYSVPGREVIYSFTPTVSGTYNITIVTGTNNGSFVDFGRKLASSGCSSAGWTCLDDIWTTGTFSAGALTAGVQYYFLLDRESTGGNANLTFRVDCLAANPCSSITTTTCGAANNTVLTGAGSYNVTTCGYTTPGGEKIYSFTPTVTGAYSITVNSTTSSYVDYFYKAASGGCSATGWTCIDDIYTTGTYPVATLTAGVQYYFLLDAEGTGSVTHNWTINCISAPYDPCTSIGAATCGTAITTTIASGTGAYDNYGIFSTPGREYIYTFTPAVSGNYTFNVNTYSVSTWLEVFYKAASGGCNVTGWTYIDDFNAPGAAAAVPMTAGVQYYIMIDPEYTTGSTINWTMTGPSATTPTIAGTTTICNGGSTTLSIGSGSLNNNTQWSWTTGTCGGTSAGTGSSITVSPTTTTTYYVRGTGGTCAPAGACGQVTVTVNNAPSITGQPSGSTICVGSALNLAVTASNAAGYQWYRNSSPIAGATAATYNVPSATTGNAGSYYCVVSGNAPCGSVQSNTVTVNVTTPASITTQPPATVTLCSGGTLSISVVAANATGYQWYRNSSPISGATAATYTVVGATSANAGTYYVVIGSNSPCASVQSGNTAVTITSPPAIGTQPPASLNVCNGSVLNMSVAATNAAGYQWYRNSVAITGATAATYNVPSATSANAGTYYVQVLGGSGCGNVNSNNTVVTVNPRPTAVLSTNAPTTICNGQFASMSVAFTGTGPWTFTRNNGSGAVTETVTSNPYTFFFVPTATTTYSITALNDVNCTAIPADYSGTATVNVNARPTATISVAGPSTICNGSSTIMSIALTGAAPWTFNYSNGITSTQVTTSTNPYTFLITPNATVTYNLNVLTDANCIANPADYAGNATVTVNPRPTAVLSIIGASTLCDGGATDMSVAFTGTAPFNFSYFDGTTTQSVTTSANPYTFTVSPSVTTSYNISALNDALCTAQPSDYAGTQTVNVNARPTAVISINGAATVCDGTPTDIDVTFTGTGPWTFDYTDGSTVTTVNTATSPYTFSVSPSVSTAYAVTSLVDGNCTAISSDFAGSAIVNVNPRPTAAVVVTGPTTICDGMSTTVDVNLTGNGPWLFDYYDGNATTTVSTPNNTYSFTVSPSTTTTYSVVTLSDNNCAAIAADMTTTGTVTVNPRPTATIAANAPTICDGSTVNMDVTLTGTGPWTFDHYDGTTTTNVTTSTSPYSFSVTPNTNTTYSIVSLVDANCTAYASDHATTAPVTVNYEPAITLQPQPVTECSGIGTMLTAAASGTALTYQWMKDGNNLSDDATYSGTNTEVLTINSITGTSGSYVLVVSGVCPPTVSTNPVAVTEDHNNIWYGAIDQMWSNPGNWSCGTIPIVTTDVLIVSNALLEPLVDIPTAICHNIHIQPNATVSFTGINSALEVKGSITNTGTFDPEFGKVIFSGNTVQNVPAVTYKDIDVEGGSIKKLDGNVTVTDVLTLSNGHIKLGQYDLLLNNPVLMIGGSDVSFVITDDTGTVIGKNMGAVGGNPDPVMFHVGTDATTYTPIMLENLGDADDYNVRVIPHVYEDGYGVSPLLVDNPVVDRTWMVEEGTVGGSIVNMNPYWNMPQEINGFDQGHVYVAHHTNGDWTGLTDDIDTAPAAGTFGSMFYADADSIMSFSPFTVASIGQFPLTIKLSDISATNVGLRNRVNWSSASEEAGDSYQLERSTDGKHFKPMTEVQAKGEASSYTYWDEKAVMGRNYYRLKMYDGAGKAHYSKVVYATVKGVEATFDISAYPNPVSHSTTLSVNGDIQGTARIVVTDVSGRVVKDSQKITARSVEIDMSSVAPGVYFIKYTDDAHNETIKVTRQ